MNSEEFRKYGHELVDWMADYFDKVESYPVLPNVKPGDIMKQISDVAPDQAESFDAIFADFKEKILPGMTHWESPNFMAYFPANKSKASVLAEMLMSTMGAQCMLWLTSPAAAELEEQMMFWLRDMLGLPKHFSGCIQDTASTATLCAILTAREKATDYAVNNEGYSGKEKFVLYCSEQIHSSIDKGAKIAGIGVKQVRKVPTDDQYAMRADVLRSYIEKDIAEGFKPLCVVSAIGTTGTTAVDPISDISDICEEFEIWHHVDAAYAGTVLILPEMRWMSEGVERADSFVFNPHKWMFTNFDCTAYFVKDPNALVNTFAISLDILKTDVDNEVKNYRDWGIPLGRRFRALKLWFVIREMGVSGIQEKIRNHIAYGKWLKEQIEANYDFELMAPVILNTLNFRFKPSEPESILNKLNKQIMDNINQSGKLFFVQNVLEGRFALRLAFGGTELEKRHVENAWELVQQEAVAVYSDYKQKH